MTTYGETYQGYDQRWSKHLGCVAKAVEAVRGYDQRWPNYLGRVTKAGGTDRGGTTNAGPIIFGRSDQS